MEDTGRQPVCYTALFGPYEELKRPTVITPGWRYICYTDQPITSDVWEILVVSVPSNTDPQRYARWFKITQWTQWERSIWVDASFVIACDLNEWWGTRAKSAFSAAKHPLRDDFFEECMDCIVSKRGAQPEVDAQMNEYLAAGLDRHAGLISSGILLRVNTPECTALCSEWWLEMQGRSARDQIAFCRVSAGVSWVHTYYWDYREGKDFVYLKHLKYR